MNKQVFNWRGLVLFSCLGIAIFVLYAILLHGLVDAIAAGYNQIVADFGNPKDN